MININQTVKGPRGKRERHGVANEQCTRARPGNRKETDTDEAETVCKKRSVREAEQKIPGFEKDKKAAPTQKGASSACNKIVQGLIWNAGGGRRKKENKEEKKKRKGKG